MFQAQTNNNNNNNNNRNSNYQTVNVGSPTAFNAGNQQPFGKRFEEMAVKIFPSYKLRSFTAIIAIFTTFMYIVQNITYYATSMNWLCSNHYWGSHYGPDMGQQYQFHRLITPIFLHQNNQHLIFNMLGIVFFGFELERYFGTAKFATLYFLSGIGGNLLSCVWHYNAFALGASTSLFGVLALQCMYVFEMQQTRSIQGDRLKRIICQLVFILGANFVVSIAQTEIDGAGHLGGFLFGGLLSIIFSNLDQIKKRKYIMVICIIILVISTIVSVYLIIHKEDNYEYKEWTFSAMKEDSKFCTKEFEDEGKKQMEKQKQEDNPMSLGGK